MKKYLCLIALFIMGIILTGCELEHEEDYKYKLTLYNLNEIESVNIDTMSQYGNSIKITDKSTIKIIYYLFADKTSNVESTSDTPSEADSLYKVDFNIEKASKSLYIYLKDNHYYLENPRNGIFESSKEDFEKLEKIISDNTYEYNLSNFNITDIASVTLSSMGQYDTPVVIDSSKDIKILYNIFSGKNSNTPSNDYNPNNSGPLYHVTFKDDYGSTKDYYIYESNDKYYIEVSLYSIFDSSETEFQIVENYLLDKNKVKG